MLIGRRELNRVIHKGRLRARRAFSTSLGNFSLSKVKMALRGLSNGNVLNFVCSIALGFECLRDCLLKWNTTHRYRYGVPLVYRQLL